MGFHIKLLVVFAVLMLSLSGCARFCVFGADSNDAINAIGGARAKVLLCYGAVTEADEAGANITALFTTLNLAGEFLSKAELAYRLGDFDSAVGNATQSQNMLDGFVLDAEALSEKAIEGNYLNFLITVGGSVVGTLIIVCGSIIVWYYIKRKNAEGAIK